MGAFDQLSPAEREQVKKLRDRGFRSLRRLCLLQLGLAFLCIVVGIALIATSAVNPKFPYIIGAPTWAGLLVAIGAFSGFKATSEGINKDDVADKVKGYVICHYVFNVLCITLSFGSAAISVLGTIFCQSSDLKVSGNCTPNHDPLLALSIVSIVLCVILGIFCILGTCYFCCYGRTLGFKSKREQRMERRMQHMQNEINQLRAAQGGGPAPPVYSETVEEDQGRYNFGYKAPGKITMIDLSRR